MTFSERFLAGFALAATIARDPGAEAARTGVCSSVVEPLTATARAWLSLPKGERRAHVSALVRPTLPDASAIWPSAATQPLRAYALLALRISRLTPADPVPSWLHAAPLPRPGYAPPPALVAHLRRIAARRGSA